MQPTPSFTMELTSKVGGWLLDFLCIYIRSNDSVWWVDRVVGVAIADHRSAAKHLQ